MRQKALTSFWRPFYAHVREERGSKTQNIYSKIICLNQATTLALNLISAFLSWFVANKWNQQKFPHIFFAIVSWEIKHDSVVEITGTTGIYIPIKMHYSPSRQPNHNAWAAVDSLWWLILANNSIFTWAQHLSTDINGGWGVLPINLAHGESDLNPGHAAWNSEEFKAMSNKHRNVYLKWVPSY